MKDPGARVVSGEADSYVVSNTAGIDDISLDWVVVVVCAASRASNDAECMLWECQRIVLKVRKKSHIRRGDGKDVRAKSNTTTRSFLTNLWIRDHCSTFTEPVAYSTS